MPLSVALATQMTREVEDALINKTKSVSEYMLEFMNMSAEPGTKPCTTMECLLVASLEGARMFS
jgi:hypothetical protein